MKDLQANSNHQMFIPLKDDEQNGLLDGTHLVIVQVREEVGYPQASLTDSVDLEGYVQGYLDAVADGTHDNIPPSQHSGNNEECKDAIYADDFEFDIDGDTLQIDLGDDTQDALDCGCLLLIGKMPGTDEVQAYITTPEGVLELLRSPSAQAIAQSPSDPLN